MLVLVVVLVGGGGSFHRAVVYDLVLAAALAIDCSFLCASACSNIVAR